MSENDQRQYDIQVQSANLSKHTKNLELKHTQQHTLVVTKPQPTIVTEAQIVKEKKQKLNLCVKIYLWMKKSWTEQVIFISNEKFLFKTRDELEKGSIDIPTRLEKKITKDVRDAVN